jgi:hypothetical protein
MTNQFRSPAFIKIKHSIQSSILPDHLTSCRQMIENSTPILSKDELVILKEYYETAKDLIYPVHAKEWDELLAMSNRTTTN